MSMRRLAAFLLLSICLIGGTIPVYAEDSAVLQLTLEGAFEKALAADDSVSDLDDTLDDLWDQHKSAKKGKEQLQDYLDSIDEYERLYDKFHENKEPLTSTERAKFKAYQRMMGEKPPTFTDQEMLDQFVIPMEFGHYAVWTEIQKLEIMQDTVHGSLTAAVQDLYINLLNLELLVKAQTQYADIAARQAEEAKLKLENGQISAYEYDQAVAEAQIQRIEQHKNERTYAQLEMNFKKMLDIPLDQDIVLTDELMKIPTTELKSYTEYETSALENRAEVQQKQYDLDRYQREFDLVNDTIENHKATAWINAELNLLDAKYAYDEAVETVKEDVFAAYVASVSALSDYQLSRQQYINELDSLEQTKALYKQGMIAETTLELAKYKFTMTELSFKNAIRTYYNTYTKLEAATSLGPAYSSEGAR